jgi:hypothetical protein
MIINKLDLIGEHKLDTNAKKTTALSCTSDAVTSFLGNLQTMDH